MAAQNYWDDIQVGSEIPALVKQPSNRQLVKWAGGSGDFYEIHYDIDFAKNNQLPSLIIQGALKNAWLGQMLGTWVGDNGWVKKYGGSYRGMDYPNDKITMRGVITKKYEANGEHLVDLDIWVENGKGEKTTQGKATVMLPVKGKA